jgi:hypothetical protein
VLAAALGRAVDRGELAESALDEAAELVSSRAMSSTRLRTEVKWGRVWQGW